MTAPATPSQPSPAGDDRNLVPVGATYIAPSFEDKLHVFWLKNGKIVIAICVLVVAGIAGQGIWDYFAANKEAGVKESYAAASSAEKLKTFVAANPGHTLAAVAQLRMADEAYAAGKFGEAATGYEAAHAALKTGPFAMRAQLGLAMAKISAGKTAEGETALKTFANDATQVKGVRAEAAYHLASLAADANRADDVKKYAELVAQIDPASPWSQRAMMLRASLPVAPEAAKARADAPAPAGVIQLKLPGK